MKVLVISSFGQNEIQDRDFVPRVGDAVDIFYKPMPKVSAVVAWPSEGTLKEMGLDGVDVEAIITVD